jgi:hypothetical protein
VQLVLGDVCGAADGGEVGVAEVGGDEAGVAQADGYAEGEPSKPAETVPCELDAGGPKMIGDCALLEHVRRSEVRAYLDQLQRRHGSVECEDGTPLAHLGAP